MKSWIIGLAGMAWLQFSAVEVYAFEDGAPAASTVVVAAQRGACPSGTNHVGAGYCRALDGRHFMPSVRGACPSGSHHVGAGYCRANELTSIFVPAAGGSCPSGMHHVGAGYCRAKQ